MKDKKLIIGILVGIFITLIIGLSSFFVYDNFFANKKEEQVENNEFNNNDNNNNNNDNELTGTKNLELSNPLVQELISKVIGIYDSGAVYADYFYQRDKIILANEPLDFRLSLAAGTVFSEIKSIDSDCSKDIGGILYIDETTLKNAYYEMFGENDSYNRGSFHFAKVCGVGTYNWSNINNRYESKGICGCGSDVIDEGSVTQLAYAKEVKNNKETKIELYEYFALSIWDDEESKFKYYSDYNKTNFIGLDVHNSKIDFFNKYSEQMGLYKYTFVQNNENNYVFTSVEKVK